MLSPTKNRSAPSSSVNACRGRAAARGASGGGGRRRRAAAFPTGVHEPAAARARRRRLDVERDQRGGARRFRGSGFGGGGGGGQRWRQTALRVSVVVRSVVPGKFRVLRRVPRGLERRPGDGESVRPAPGGARGSFASSPGTFPATAVVASDRPSVDFGLASTETTASASSFRLEVREVVGRGRGPRRPRGGVGRRGRGHGGRRPAVRGVPCVAGEPRRDSRRERGGCRVGRGRGRRGASEPPTASR